MNDITITVSAWFVVLLSILIGLIIVSEALAIYIKWLIHKREKLMGKLHLKRKEDDE